MAGAEEGVGGGVAAGEGRAGCGIMGNWLRKAAAFMPGVRRR